jgi:Ca2+/Na+ antiporter
MMVGSSTSPSELKRLSAVLGGLFVGMGMVIMLFGLIRYFTTQHYLLSDKFPVARATVFLAFVATFAVSLVYYDAVNLTNQLVIITFGILIRVTT